ncbi:hypothetical protein N0496_21300, partial [Pseudomonas aeruginosa]|nr:hypothetical protein [Pseudomonas aeruginosa]
MNLIRLVALVFVGACGTSTALAAEPLRLEEAVSRALAAHPSIAAETAQLQAVRARTQREALPPPYTIGGEVGVWGAMEPKTNVSPTNAFRCLLPRRP